MFLLASLNKLILLNCLSPLPHSPPHPVIPGDDDLLRVLSRRVGSDDAGGEHRKQIQQRHSTASGSGPVSL
jgi:hypothetical protein